jgi:hypothetical protein
MSYDISFKVKVENVDCFVRVGDRVANTTWNVREMIVKSTGLEWHNEANNGFCKDIILCIEKGYNELTYNPEKYKKYEAENGWGTVESTKEFFKNILVEWEDFCKCYPELIEVTTFWIE